MLARANGADGVRIEDPRELRAALDQAPRDAASPS